MSNVSDDQAPLSPKKSGGADLVLRVLMWACVLVALGFSANAYFYGVRPAQEGVKITDAASVRSAGLVTIVPKHLASEFTDSQGRLLADPPSAPDQLLDPQTIVIGRWESSDADTPDVDWTALAAHISKAVGRKVSVVKFDNGPAQIAQIKKGAFALVALHAADVPFLVNNCGYQPAAVLADASAGVSGNHLDIIVPPNSSITNNTDLRGHTLMCTVPSSITGYRAAVATLLQDDNLRPNVDYFITWSLKQKESIKAVKSARANAAAVSDDKLNSMLDKGTIDKSDYKIIYQSQVIPRMTIGWFYNLKPELADKLKAAILSYVPPGSAASSTTRPAVAASDTDDTSGEQMRWVPTDYKNDFKFVRAIDDNFDPRLDTKAVK